MTHTHTPATREIKEDGKNNIKRTNNVCKTKIGQKEAVINQKVHKLRMV